MIRERNQSLTFFSRYDSCYAQTQVRERRRRLSFERRISKWYAMRTTANLTICQTLWNPQEGNLTILLQVQLRGDPRWYKVKISCPLPGKRADRIQLVLTCACWRLSGFLPVVPIRARLGLLWIAKCSILVHATSCYVQVRVTKSATPRSATWELWSRTSPASGMWPSGPFSRALPPTWVLLWSSRLHLLQQTWW